MHLSDNATLRGLVWMIACGVLFSALNMLQKLLTYQLHPPQVTCLRYFVGSLLLLPFVIPGGWARYRPRRPALHVWRGLFHVTGSLIWIATIPLVGLAEASAISFTGPTFMMLGGVLFLRERMYGARWAAVLIAFAGVLIVLWPGLADSDAALMPTVWMLVASPLFAVSFLLSKVLTRYDSPQAIVFWLGVAIFSFSLPFAVFALEWPLRAAWQWPTALQWTILVGCGLAGASSHYCMTRAYRIADVSAVQSVRFLDLVWAAILGFLVFGQLPSEWALAGGSVICAATLWIARYEARHLHEVKT